jgi:hypothetical protein
VGAVASQMVLKHGVVAGSWVGQIIDKIAV